MEKVRPGKKPGNVTNWEFRKDSPAKVGYRQIYGDCEEDYTVWDMTASGIYLGLGIRF